MSLSGSWLHAPPERLGRRGSVLLILGIIWIIQGVGALIAPPIYDPSSSALLYLLIPGPVRFTMWASTGIAAIVYAWRKPPKADGIGYAALVVMPIERAFSFAWAWFVSIVGDPGEGLDRGWISAFAWWSIVVFIATIAGWPEAPAIDPNEAP